MLCFVQIVAFSLISAEIMCTGTVHGLTCHEELHPDFELGVRCPAHDKPLSCFEIN